MYDMIIYHIYRLKAMVERFGKSHAGQALTQLPSRPYSYLVDMVMDNYAYAYAMYRMYISYAKSLHIHIILHFILFHLY